MDEPVEDLGTELSYHMFFTFSNRKVDLWKIQHLYNIHTAIGYYLLIFPPVGFAI